MIDINRLLTTAVEAGASDIHLTVGIPPKMRVNGRLVSLPAYDEEGHEVTARLMPPDTLAIASSIMDEKQMALFEERGEYDMSYSVLHVGRYRVNVFKQRGSIAMALRLVGTEIPDPVALGLPESVVKLAECKRGLVLVTGPTGSGKSTTLASIIDRINKTRDAHVITLEDPIEYLHRHDMSIVNQREIGLDSSSYAFALRAALREDPDVIQVGEMRDYDTMSVAITAAETGHLVLSTLHTMNAPSTVERIIDIFPSHQQQQVKIQLSNVLQAVISQQLVPTADGKGRIAAFELMYPDPAIRHSIHDGNVNMLAGQIQTGASRGMISMDDALIKLFREGKITRETAIEFAQNKETMANKV